MVSVGVNFSKRIKTWPKNEEASVFGTFLPFNKAPTLLGYAYKYKVCVETSQAGGVGGQFGLTICPFVGKAAIQQKKQTRNTKKLISLLIILINNNLFLMTKEAKMKANN